MESLSKINRLIRKSGMKSSTDFLNAFLDNEDNLLVNLREFKGAKSEVYLKEVNRDLANTLKFSSIFSDVTLVNTTPSSINEYQVTSFQPESKYFRERQLTIPADYVNETGTDPGRFIPCYIYRNDSETRTLFKDYSSLVKKDRLIIRPLRALIVDYHEIEKITVFYVDPNTNNDHWFINKIEEKDSIIIDNGYLPYKNTLNLFDITLPYFENINISVLSKILDEESEILETFRYKLSEVIKKAGDEPLKIQEIKNDIALSSIEKLNRRFKAIQNKHKFIVKASLSTFVLTLAIGKIDTDLLAKLLAATISVMGGSEYDMQLKQAELKDEPYYLLWKISKGR